MFKNNLFINDPIPSSFIVLFFQTLSGFLHFIKVKLDCNPGLYHCSGDHEGIAVSRLCTWRMQWCTSAPVHMHAVLKLIRTNGHAPVTDQSTITVQADQDSASTQTLKYMCCTWCLSFPSLVLFMILCLSTLFSSTLICDCFLYSVCASYHPCLIHDPAFASCFCTVCMLVNKLISLAPLVL